MATREMTRFKLFAMRNHMELGFRKAFLSSVTSEVLQDLPVVTVVVPWVDWLTPGW